MSRADEMRDETGPDLLVERAARGMYEMRGLGPWSELLPARKEAHRSGVRLVLEFIDRSLAQVQDAASGETK